MKRSLTTTAALAAIAIAAGAGIADEKMADGMKTEVSAVEIGKPVPSFTLTDQDGNEVSLSDFEGRVVVLEWTNPTCPFVKAHYSEDKTTMIDMASNYSEDDVVWLAIDSSHFCTAEDHKKWAAAKEIDYPILADASGAVGRVFNAATTPHMFVIDGEGVLRYTGAIDDNPRGTVEEPTNYVKAAIDAVLAGEDVAVTKTKSYGCSVKYAKGV